MDSLNKPDIAFQFSHHVPEEIIKEIDDIFQQSKIPYFIEKQENKGPYAGIEWLLPTAIGVFILPSYFGGMFGEMGKDHYLMIKKAMKKIGYHVFKNKTIQISYISSSNSPKKINNNFSATLSFIVKAPTGKNYKFIFPQNISYDEYLESIDKILEFVNKKSELLEFIEKNKNIVITEMLVCTYDIKQSEIIALDPLKRENKPM